MLIFDKKDLKVSNLIQFSLNNLNKFIKKKNFILKILILISSISVLFIPLDLGSKKYPFNLFKNVFVKSLGKFDKRYEFLVNESFLYGDSLIKIGFRYLKSSFIRLENVNLNISFKNFKRLENKRNEAMKNKILIRSQEDKVKGFIEYKEDNFPVRLRLKGDWTDHLLGDKWSFRAETRKNKSFLGMKEFSLQHPRTRNYINEYVFQKLLEYEELPFLRYEFLPLSINGKYLGIYAVEEHFSKELLENSGFREGPIIKLSDADKRGEFQRLNNSYIDQRNYKDISEFNADIQSFNFSKLGKNKSKVSEFNLATYLLDNFINSKLNTSDVFDLKKTATFFALADLMHAGRSNTWYDMRFYFDPIIARLIPVGYDAQPPIRTYGGRHLSLDLNVLNIFDDQLFQESYIKALEKISNKNYFQEFIDSISDDLKDNLEKINKSYPHVRFIEEEIFKNQKYIKTRLNPLNPISVHTSKYNILNSNLLNLKIYNKTLMPIEIESIKFQDKIFLPSSKKFLEARNKYSRVKYENFEFVSKNKNKIMQPILLDEIFIKFKFSGSQKIQNFNSRMLPPDNSTESSNELVTRKPNYKDFSFLDINHYEKEIIIKKSSRIDKSLILPKNYTLKIIKGTKLFLDNNASILVQGPLVIEGTFKKPVEIISKDIGNGLIVLNAYKESSINNAVFDGLSSPNLLFMNITGGVTFYNSPVKILNSLFRNSNSEDSLNLVRSDFKISRTKFTNSSSDALDVDFSNGELGKVSFMETGNDAIDISGSNVIIYDADVKKAGDKAISVGEKSYIKASNININNSYIALASKDFSNVEISNLKVKNSKICLAAYQKKSEYGPGFIKVINSDDSCKKYVLEKGSSIQFMPWRFVPNTENAYKDLYEE